MAKHQNSTDVLIVGAGIIGVAVGSAILKMHPNTKVLIIEKEDYFNLHASGRNSGVLHSGFYYSPDSMKAKFCSTGNKALKKLIRNYNIPILDCGKVIVAKSEEENLRLDQLLESGIKNGVELEMVDERKLPNFEPLAVTSGRFIWSPNTSVSDPSAILFALRREFETLGGKIDYGSEISIGMLQEEVVDLSGNFNFKVLINAAGAHSLGLAHKIDVGSQYISMPFLGLYRASELRRLPLSKLVYPVPHAVNPFLGVHLTITNNNKVKMGPTAIPVIGLEQYEFFKKVSYGELRDSIRAFMSIALGVKHKVSELYIKEFMNVLPNVMLSQASKIVPYSRQVKDWKPVKSGIRGQLYDSSKKELAKDFIIESKNNSIHILNTVSPGWTSAIPFGEHIVSNYLQPKLT